MKQNSSIKFNNPQLSKVLISVMGFFCAMYALFTRNFAEVNVQFPFLDFPIFVGEILLGVCLTSLFLQWKTEGWKFTTIRVTMLIYLAWILVKAFEGYYAGGALAFRNAALFYYAIFAWVGFEVFRKDFFSRKLIILVLSVFLVMKLFCFNEAQIILRYHEFPMIFLAIALIMNLEKSWQKLIFAAAFILIFPIQSFFEGSRSNLVGIIVSLFYLTIIMTTCFIHRKWRIPISFVMLMLIIFCVYKFSENGRLVNLLNLSGLKSAYQEQMKVIKSKEATFKLKEIKPRLYRKEARDLTSVLANNSLWSKDQKVDLPELTNLVHEAVQDSINESAIIEDAENKQENVSEKVVLNKKLVNERRDVVKDSDVLYDYQKVIAEQFNSDKFNYQFDLLMGTTINMFEVNGLAYDEVIKNSMQSLKKTCYQIVNEDTVFTDVTFSQKDITDWDGLLKLIRFPNSSEIVVPLFTRIRDGLKPQQLDFENPKINEELKDSILKIFNDGIKGENLLGENTGETNRLLLNNKDFREAFDYLKELGVYSIDGYGLATIKRNADVFENEMVGWLNIMMLEGLYPQVFNKKVRDSHGRLFLTYLPDIRTKAYYFVDKFIKKYEIIMTDKLRKGIELDKARPQGEDFNNTLFRLFIWKDMIEEYVDGHLLWGLSFGHPQRSKSIEMLMQAWDVWSRDGWITPHNSFLHIIYRGGIIGWALIVFLLTLFVRLTIQFVQSKNLTGILLLCVLLYWIVVSLFLVFLEVPYSAIPFWIFIGMLCAYQYENKMSDFESRTVKGV